MFYAHFFGHTVRHLRHMRTQGATAYQMMEYLRKHFPNFRPGAALYMNYAFLGRGLRLVTALRLGNWQDHSPDSEVWPIADAIIDGAKSEWGLWSVPELMRMRDYFAFLQFTKQQHAIVVVCGASPNAGRWIGRPETSCYDGRLFVPTRGAGPYSGLLAADPADQNLQTSLEAYGGTLSYSDYVASLREDGFRVLGPEDEYILEDRFARRLYQGYRLHGVFDAKSYEPLWTGGRGESLRATLNRCLGAELVRFGPHDQWVHRNDKAMAGPLWGPQTPAIAFDNGERVDNRLSARDLAMSPPYESTWAELYPQHALKKEA
jgi:hypothetical protein